MFDRLGHDPDGLSLIVVTGPRSHFVALGEKPEVSTARARSWISSSLASSPSESVLSSVGKSSPTVLPVRKARPNERVGRVTGDG